MKKGARASDVQAWQRQQQAAAMPSLQQQQPAPPPQQQQQQQQPQAQFANHANWYSAPHYPQPDIARRQQEQQGHFAPYGAPPPTQAAQQQHHPAVQPHGQQPPVPAAQQQQPTPTPAAAPTPRQRKRPAPSQQAAHTPTAHPQQHVQHGQQHSQHPQHPQPHLQQQQHQAVASPAQPHQGSAVTATPVTQTPIPPPTTGAAATPAPAIPAASAAADDSSASGPPPSKKSRTNTPWTPAEEHRLKQMRDAGNSWAEIAKTFPTRTEGSVKKHWYKDMHYAEFAEDEVPSLHAAAKAKDANETLMSQSQALLNAIKEYENNKWKTIGQKVGKPAKACEQYAKEHFPDIFATPKPR